LIRLRPSGFALRRDKTLTALALALRSALGFGNSALFGLYTLAYQGFLNE